jgi:uncharacterized protein (TIGR03437 family)
MFIVGCKPPIKSLRLLVACSLIPVCGAAAGASTTLAHLPNTGVNAVKVDASGNIYIAGFQGTGGTPASYDAFVAKLSPDGSKIFYSTTFAGSGSDYAIALDIDSTGAAYIFGRTESPDFPVTPGALQTTMLAPSVQGFVIKVDAQGKVVYSTLIGDASDIYPSSGGLVVDAAGEAIVSGQTIGKSFPTAPGPPFASTDTNTFFVLKLDATGGKLLAAVRGIGGLIALDNQGSIYIAGIAGLSYTPIPVTQGAFQPAYQGHFCSGGGQILVSCTYQYVTKLNAGLTQIVYSTYVTGSWGAAPAAVGVDAQGSVLLAGITHSPDYPTTSGAFEPVYFANAPAPPQVCLYGCISPPPASGYVTKLNATGTALVDSTFFSGSQSDTITFAAFTTNGTYLSGQAGSPDLPGLEGVPSQCLALPATFETRLTSDGSAVAATRIVSANVLAYDPVTGVLLAWNGTDLISFDPAAPPTPIACIVDSADLQPVSSIAPGELLSIFGAHFVNGIAGQAPGSFATSLAGVTVTFNGVPGPLLYVSPQQINVQAPYEIGNSSQASLVLTSSQTNDSDSWTLPVIARNPAAFLDTVTPQSSVTYLCPSYGQAYAGGPLPLAFNGDGSRNTCSNPASAGSVVTIFLAGLGVTVPAPVTGSINPNPGVPLNLPITVGNGVATIVSAISAAGSISGVWQVGLRTPANEAGAISISLSAGSVPARDTNLTVWIH